MSDSAEQEELLKPQQICTRLKISERTLSRWLEHAAMPCLRLGPKTRRFKWQEVEEWIKSGGPLRWTMTAAEAEKDAR